MPGNLMRYSGLITKTRAMSGNLLTKEELRQMTELTTVNEAIHYLKGTRSYGSIFQGQDAIWHRGQAESAIVKSMYQNFEKLYQFSDASQKMAFQYVLFRYEVDILKLCLKSFCQKEQADREIYVDPFFYKHSRFPMEKVKRASDLQELEQALLGTPYETIFMQMHNSAKARYADYAMSLDLYYYTCVFKSIRKMRSSDLKRILLEIYGTQIDWLNIMWIYRSKRFYDQTKAELAAATIPYVYRLKKEELKGLLAASDLAELNKILEGTGYFRGKEAFVQMEDEISYKKIIGAMYRRISQKYPVSIAPVLKYIYEKEQEIERVTTIIEGIRYQLPSREIKDLILITI